MTASSTADGTFHVRFDPPACVHTDGCSCDSAYDVSREQLAAAIETCTTSLGLLAWIEIDGDQMYVLREMEEVHEFLGDALSGPFDVRFDGVWLTLRTWSESSSNCATYTLLPVPPAPAPDEPAQ
jgi:hypothetical protein